MSTKHSSLSTDDVQKKRAHHNDSGVSTLFTCRIDFKILLPVSKVHNGLGPLYLSDLLLTSKTLRSSGTGLLIILEPTVRHPFLIMVHVCGTACLRIWGEQKAWWFLNSDLLFSLAFSWILFILYLLNRLSLSTAPWAVCVCVFW